MATAHKSRVLDMTQGDPFRLVLQFSMPLFCSNLLQQLYNLTDTALAGHLLGSAALAEIGATAALYGLIMNFAFGMNNGLALTVSRYFGAGDESGIRRAVGWMVTLSAAVSLVLTGCSLLGRDALLTVLQVPAQAWGGASAYLTVILLGIPLTMLYNMEAALLRAVGNSVTPLLFLLFSSVLNVGLDAAFMGPLGLGVRGAAIATVLAQGIRDSLPQPVRVPAAEAAAFRPDYAAAQLRSDRAEAGIRAARAAFNPQLSVGIGGSWQPYYPNRTGATTVDGSAFVKLSLPIFHWGERRRATGVARAVQRQSEWDAAQLYDDIVREEMNGWTALENSRAQVEAMEQSLRIAGENLDISTYSYGEGLATILDVLQAQLSWIQLYTNAIKAHYNYAVAVSDYRRITAQQ